jgi:phenylacetate-CoA ligase
MYRFLHRHLLLPAFESGVKRRNTMRYWRELERSQWFSPQQLEKLQLRNLRRLLRHAFDHCPYYRQAWSRAGLDPVDVKKFDDFRSWPTTDRDTIRQQRLQMRAQVPGMQLYAKATGGSSGVPVQFDLNVDSDARRTAAWHRGYGWAGAEPGTKQFYLWGVSLGERPRWRVWKDALYHRFHRRLYANSFELSEAEVPRLLERLNRYRPDAIVAYTNPLYYFAKSLDERGLTPYSPRSIVVGAEKLHPFQRTLIEKVFRAPVFESYGSREVMLIGSECDRHEGLHLTSEVVLVEILDDDGTPTLPGEEGNVVITDLHNFGMPFIRYANGDRALAGWGTCSCGRGLPLLRRVVGRRLDVLHTPDGRRLPGEFFPHLLKDFPEVQRFQVIQDRADSVELRVVLKDGWKANHRDVVQQEASKLLGPQVCLKIAAVDEIPLTPAGKLRVVVNRTAEYAAAD